MSQHLAREMVQRFVDGELDAAGQAAVRAHLQHCDTCRGYIEGLQQTEALLHQIPRLTVPATFTAQVMDRLHTPAPTCVWAGRGARWFAWGTGLAGLLVLGLTLAEALMGDADQAGWQQLFMAVAAWVGPLFQVPGATLAPLDGDLTRVWQALLRFGETALPLGLALLALGGFIQMLRWLTGLNDSQQPGMRVRY